MKVDDIRTIGVIGAGTMGHAIAEVAALAGYRVHLRDVSQELVERGRGMIEWSLGKLAERGQLPRERVSEVLGLVSPVVDMAEAVGDADLVIEAVPEVMKLKRETFAELDRAAPPGAVLATNTSSLSVTDIARGTSRPERVVGMHFFNPVVRMRLVEVVRGERTPEEVMGLATAFAERLGKQPIRVEKDVFGFIVNRILVEPFLFEAGWIVSRGEGTIPQVDSCMRHREGFPMGPFELQDLTGVDVGVHLMEEAGRPVPPVIRERVDQGKLGRKTGEGFYNYRDGGADYAAEAGRDFDPLPIYALMTNEAGWLVQEGVAAAEQVDLALRLGANFPEGVLRRADRLGLDRLLETLERLYTTHGEQRYRPTGLLSQLVSEGKTGEAAGEGFYRHKETREYATIRVELDLGRRIGWIVLNRPDRLNAMNRQMRRELPHALEELGKDGRVAVVVIRGAGDRAFAAGADIGEFRESRPYEFTTLEPCFQAPERCPKPVIAAIDGFALGGGLELAMACDFRIASRRSRVGQPEINLGLIPGGGGTQRLPRLIGLGRAKQLVMTGERLSAEEAHRWGLLNQVVEEAHFEEEVTRFAERLAAAPPVALRVAKQVMNQGTEVSLDAGLLLERQGFSALFSTDDFQEGVDAFVSKRSPAFRGS